MRGRVDEILAVRTENVKTAPLNHKEDVDVCLGPVVLSRHDAVNYGVSMVFPSI